jgi:hypothetical protein
MNEINLDYLNKKIISQTSSDSNFNSLFGKCRSVTDFEKIEEIGEGTYGRVCKYF